MYTEKMMSNLFDSELLVIQFDGYCKLKHKNVNPRFY